MSKTSTRLNASSSPTFTPDDRIIGERLGSIADPEFYCRNGTYQMAYLQAPYIFVVDIDPLTGDIAGEPTRLCDNAVGFIPSGVQGPEFGWDNHNRLILFTLRERDGKSQVACVFQDDTSPTGWSEEPVILTDAQDDRLGRMGATPSRQGKDGGIQINYSRWLTGNPQLGSPKERIINRQFYWLDAHAPTIEHPVEGEVIFHTQPPQWVGPRDNVPDARCDLLYSSWVASDGEPEVEQIVRYRVSDNTRHVLTQDTYGHKWDPDSILVPGSKQRIYLAGLLERGHELPNALALYQEADGASPYDALALKTVLRIPPQDDVSRFDRYVTIRSVEPFCAGNKLFFALRLVKGKANAMNPIHRDAVVCVWSQDEGGLQRQVSLVPDDPETDQEYLRGKDPEVVVGEKEVFIYYSTYVKEEGSEEPIGKLHLCRTGIAADGSY